MNFHGITDKGNQRKYNEDFVDGFIHQNALFLLVGDGQGSDEFGIAASRIAIHEMRNYIEREYKRGMDLKTLLSSAFYLAHRVIEGVRKGDTGRYNGLSTSLTVVAITEQKQITIAHIGNTKLFLVRGGEFIQMTKDHTVAQGLLEQRKITPQELPTHPERAILTRGLGVFEEANPDITQGMVQTGDILLLVSDGITEHLTQEEIKTLVQQAGNNQLATEYLVQGANERGGWDNLSAIASYINF